MKIDLHCHTKRIKSGEDSTRTVTKEKFTEKVLDANVKIIAITNHNHFDYEQFIVFSKSVDGFCDIWPGVELDISGKKGKGHLIVIANPNKAKIFSEVVSRIVGDTNPNNFEVKLSVVHNEFKDCDVLYIPHFHKDPKLSNEDIEELSSLMKDKSRLFKETSDYRSLGVYSNFNYSVIIGSDNHEWDNYPNSKFAEIRLPIQTFEQFCLLAKKDKVIIDTLLNKKKSLKINVSPHKNVHFPLRIYEDINVIFGQKGTGKSEIIKSIKKYYDEMNITNQMYTGSEKESDFSKLLSTSDMKIDLEKLGIHNFSEEFMEMYNWKDEMPTNLENYIEWIKTVLID